ATLSEAPARYVVVGGGKTAIDACLWLLERDVAPERIRWIKARECWLVNREFTQSGANVASILDGLSLQMEAAAQAESIADLFSASRRARSCCVSTRALSRPCSSTPPS